jgi:transmembrane sensor
MPKSQAHPGYNEQIRSEATDWLIRFCEDEVDGSARAQFYAWLRASPEHVRAYLEISAFWEAAGRLNSAPKADIDALLRQAELETNVIPLDPTIERTGEQRSRRSVAFKSLALAASVLFAGLLVTLALWWHSARYPTYVTKIGEQRVIILPDGSRVELNARSRVRILFDTTTRRVELLEGQALFQVARSPLRPFIVVIGTARVRAIGTQFDVYRQSSGTVVTVVEGRVAVSASAADGPGRLGAVDRNEPDALVLSAGEQVALAPRAPRVSKLADTGAVTAWTEGKLVFEATPLSEVIEEFNRYNTRPLLIDDPQLLKLHVSGTFATSDSNQMVRFLTQRFGLVVHETNAGVRLSPE